MTMNKQELRSRMRLNSQQGFGTFKNRLLLDGANSHRKVRAVFLDMFVGRIKQTCGCRSIGLRSWSFIADELHQVEELFAPLRLSDHGCLCVGRIKQTCGCLSIGMRSWSFNDDEIRQVEELFAPLRSGFRPRSGLRKILQQRLGCGGGIVCLANS